MAADIARVGPTQALWAISAADLAANLLCFFVLQFAMSEMDVERFRAASEGIGRGLGVETRARPQPTATLTLPAQKPRASLSVDYLAALLASEVAPGRPLAAASLHHTEDRLMLSFPGVALFESGSDQMRGDAQEIVHVLAGLLAGVSNRVEVQSHVPPDAERAAGLPSSWELALMRASGVAARLREAGYTRPLAISGRVTKLAASQAAEPHTAAAESITILIGAERAR